MNRLTTFLLLAMLRMGAVLSLSLAAAVATVPLQAAAQTAEAARPPVTAGKTLTLGAGDQVRVVVFQNPELGLETRVDGDGRITFPFLGTLEVGGKDTAEVERMVASGLEQRNVLKRPQVSVVVTQYRSQQVAVLGYVNRPGQYVLDMAFTVSGALAQAGGVGAGGADVAVLSRFEKGELKNTEIDLVQMFRPGASRAQDVLLQPGDVLFVHRAPSFFVYGQVQRPGMQRLERDMTVLQAVSASGGLTERGTDKRMRITRRGADGELTTVEVDRDARLQADDVLYVRESWF